jgi:hypothetical protein
MTNSRFRWNLFAVLVLAMVFAGMASAQAGRTWVSGVGDDVNPCSRTAPCKTFAGAISKTADGGEINCLDPGGFGGVTITKSIKIDCQQTGGISANGVNGIIINAGANGVVSLRNFQINGLLPTAAGAGASGINGIRYLSGKFVHIENLHIAGFGGTGTSGNCIDVAISSGAGQLSIENSTLEHCTVGINQANSTIASNVFVVNNRFEKIGTALKSKAASVMGATLNSFSDITTVIFDINGGSIFTGNDNVHFNEALVGATSGGLSKI